MSTLKTRISKLERVGRPVDVRRLQQIQTDVLAELPEAQRGAFERLVDSYLALAPTTRSSDAIWDALLARPQDELDALVELHARCQVREIAAGARPAP